MQDTQSAHFSRKKDVSNVNIVLKTMCLDSYLHNWYIGHVLGYMMNDYTLLVKMNQKLLNKLRYCKLL